MKQYLIAIAMLLTLATTTQAAAQKHRHSAAVTVSVTPQDTAGIEAFSDTTGVAEEEDSLITYATPPHLHVNLDSILGEIPWGDVAGMLMIICVVFIIFLLAPVFIIAAIFYFINKNRKDKLKLAQMAIQNRQPIPEPLISDMQPMNSSNNFHSGIRQVFLGIGLMILLDIILGRFGLGIGALVFFIGLGKLAIAYLDNHKSKDNK